MDQPHNVFPAKPKPVTQYDLIEAKLDNMVDDIKEIKEQLKSSFVRHDQFTPVKLVVYGACGMILASVFGLIVTLALRGTHG